MVNGAFHLSARPNDLGFQGCDARLQLGDRQGIKILARQFSERIARLFRENLVQIHERER